MRRGEPHRAEREWLAHRRVRRTKEDERIGLGRERGRERAVRTTIALPAPPRIDVERHEAPAVWGRRGARVGFGEARVLEVGLERAALAMVRAPSVCGRPDRGLREFALHPRARLAK